MTLPDLGPPTDAERNDLASAATSHWLGQSEAWLAEARHGALPAQAITDLRENASTVDWPHCMRLVDLGYMSHGTGSQLTGGDDVFWVTDKGRRVAESLQRQLYRPTTCREGDE